MVWLFRCLFDFSWKGNIRAKFTEKQSVKIINLPDSSMALLLVLSVLNVGGFVDLNATLLRIVESIEENK